MNGIHIYHGGSRSARVACATGAVLMTVSLVGSLIGLARNYEKEALAGLASRTVASGNHNVEVVVAR